jgi:hypothetical protein
MCEVKLVLVLRSLVFAECPCAVVESGVLAATCRTCAGALLLQTLFYLFENWWAGASLVGFRMSGQETYVTSHLNLRFCLCIYPVLGLSTLGGDFFPIIVTIQRENVSQVKAFRR